MIEAAIATRADEPELRRLLRDIPMPGALSLSFEREPDLFAAGAIEGDRHDTVLVRDASGAAVGLGTRSVRDAWLDGAPGRLGYLSQLRIVPSARGKTTLRAGFAMMQALHDADPVPLYVTTVIKDNVVARRALERERPGKPSYRPCGELVTLALLVGRPRRAPRLRGYELRAATAADLGAVAACLERHNRRYQFAPVWTERDLRDPARCRGLHPGDFLVAVRGGHVAGCLAYWDQQGFKQSVVRGYAGPIAAARPLYNAAAPWLGLPRLPGPGEPVPHAYVSHVAVDHDRADVLLPLLAAAMRRGAAAGLAYLTLAFCEGHPLLEPVRRRSLHLAYRAILYTVCFPGAEAARAALGARTPHVELAVL